MDKGESISEMFYQILVRLKRIPGNKIDMKPSKNLSPARMLSLLALQTRHESSWIKVEGEQVVNIFLSLFSQHCPSSLSSSLSLIALISVLTTTSLSLFSLDQSTCCILRSCPVVPSRSRTRLCVYVCMCVCVGAVRTYVLVRFGEFGSSCTGQLHRVRPPPAQQ